MEGEGIMGRKEEKESYEKFFCKKSKKTLDKPKKLWYDI